MQIINWLKAQLNTVLVKLNLKPQPNKHAVIILGQEQVGVPPELLQMAQDTVYITQYGSVRSLNVGTASGIAMYDYCKKVIV